MNQIMNMHAAVMTPSDVKHLAWELQSHHLYQCVTMYETGCSSWSEAMQIAAVELAKVVEIQNKEIYRLRSICPIEVFNFKEN